MEQKGEKNQKEKKFGEWKGDSEGWMLHSLVHSVDISLYGLSKVNVLNHLDTLNLPFVHQEALYAVMQGEEALGADGTCLSPQWSLFSPLYALCGPPRPSEPFTQHSSGNVQRSGVLGRPHIMSPSGWLECGAIVLPGAIKPPPGQTRASLFLYGAWGGNKERSHWDTVGPPFVWCPFCCSSMPGLGRGGSCWSLAFLISLQSLVWPKWRCELNWLEWPLCTMLRITWRRYREGIVHMRVSLAAQLVMKTCEESFMAWVVPANETLESFMPPDFGREM